MLKRLSWHAACASCRAKILRVVTMLGMGILVGALSACDRSERVSSNSPIGLPPGPISCPAGGDLAKAADIVPALLPNEATLREWETFMVNLGPRFTGSAALKGWHDFMANQLTEAGLTVVREPIPIDWWLHQKWSLKLVKNGVETNVSVASYFPYSGHTPEGGVIGNLVDVGNGLGPEVLLGNVSGKIAYIEADQLPATAALFYATASYVYDPDATLTPLTDYTRMSLSFVLTPQLLSDPVGSLYYAKQGGAIGAIISLKGSPENVAGQYTPFLGYPATADNVPTLYVDRATGDLIKAEIAAGAQARLELVVQEHAGDSTDDIIATLPGMTDEVVIVNTHTDGTSSSEENGGIGVMALARYFATIPKSCRQKTMVFVLTPGHFNGGIGGDTGRFIAKHPEIIGKAVASLTTEHLGQMEWLDDADGYHPSGLPEPAVFYGSIAPAVQTIMKNAVVAEDLRRVFVSRPIGIIYFGVGSALNSAGVPNAAYLTGPNSMLSFADNQHLDHVDYRRMAAEVRTFTRIAADFQATDSAVLCLAMPPSTSLLATGCLSSLAPSKP